MATVKRHTHTHDSGAARAYSRASAVRPCGSTGGIGRTMKELYRRYRETYGIPTAREWLCFAEIVALMLLAGWMFTVLGAS